ncbi:MAG: TRAP transporter small permease [Dehalococcoidia bacterium]|nr:TRAP transporter small permease [Dehalococcoidia bacterium]
MRNGFNKFTNVVNLIARWLNWIAGASLVIMVVLVMIDVIGTKAFKTPLLGGIELVSLLSVIAIALAIAQTQIAHGHIEVEMLVEKFPKNLRHVIAAIVHILGIVLFVILSWKSFDYGKALHNCGEVSMTLQLPYYPFVYALGISSIIVALVLLVQFIKIIKES